MQRSENERLDEELAKLSEGIFDYFNKLFVAGYDLALLSDDVNPIKYGLRLMSDSKREPEKIYLEKTDEGLVYEVIGLDGELKNNVIPWDQLSPSFRSHLSENIPPNDVYYSNLLYYISKAGHAPTDKIFYVRMKEGSLEYKVINPKGETINDTINKEDLEKILTLDELAVLKLEPFDPNKIAAFLSKILKITAEKGHTLEENVDIFALIATEKGGSGRIFVDMCKPSKSLISHEPIHEIFRNSHAIHQKFLEQISSFTPAYTNETEKTINNMMTYYFNGLLRNNSQWEEFKERQKDLIKTILIEDASRSEKPISERIDESWHKLENDLSGALIFKIINTAIPESEPEKQKSLGIYMPLINAGLDTHKGIENQKQKMITGTIAPAINSSLYLANLKEGNKKKLMATCLDFALNFRLYDNPKVLSFGDEGQKQMFIHMLTLLKAINQADDNKKLKKEALNYLSNTILNDLHSRFASKPEYLKSLTPNTVGVLLELTQLTLDHADKKIKKQMNVFAGEIALSLGEKERMDNAMFVSSAPTVKLPRSDSSEKERKMSTTVPTPRRKIKQDVNPRSLALDTKKSSSSKLKRSLSGRNLRAMVSGKEKEKENVKEHHGFLAKSGSLIAHSIMKPKKEKVTGNEEKDESKKEMTSPRRK